MQQPIQASGKVAPLYMQHVEASQIFCAVFCSSGGADGLFAHVVQLQSHNRHPVHDHAGCLGMQHSIGSLLQLVEEGAVDGLDEIVTPLVELVDGALDGSDTLIRGIGAAREIFLVPEVEVGTMLEQDEPDELGRGTLLRRMAGLMPPFDGFILQTKKVCGLEDGVSRHIQDSTRGAGSALSGKAGRGRLESERCLPRPHASHERF